MTSNSGSSRQVPITSSGTFLTPMLFAIPLRL
jgi:hypothetical protein